MGGIGSGTYKREPEKIKANRFKIYGLKEKDKEGYFYYGVTKQYLTKMKHYIIYFSRRNMHDSKLVHKIQELNYNFDIVELEKLPMEWGERESRMWLQERYLDKETPECNHLTYCMCNTKEIIEERTKKYQERRDYVNSVQKKIIEDYIEHNYTRQELSNKYDITLDHLIYILKKYKVSKKERMREFIYRVVKLKEDFNKLSEEYKLDRTQKKYYKEKIYGN